MFKHKKIQKFGKDINLLRKIRKDSGKRKKTEILKDNALKNQRIN